MIENPARFAPATGRRGIGARLAAIVLLVLTPVAGKAVVPASPQLERLSRNALVKALAEAGIPKDGSSAVLNALLFVLGTEPAGRQYRYSEPYPQLPDVNATAVPAEEGCAKVELTVMPKTEPKRPVKLKGLYCLEDRASYTWRARSQKAEAP